MRSAQKIVLEGNNIKIPSRTQLKELDKNFEFTLLILFSLFHFPSSYSLSYPFISTLAAPWTGHCIGAAHVYINIAGYRIDNA
jgi:hypothetical protein